MQTTTVVLIFLAAIFSFAFAWFQYFFKKKENRINKILAFLRFIMVFGLLVLLINPKFTKNNYSLEKSNLILAIDNSSSIASLEGDSIAKAIFNNLSKNMSLLERFDLATYSFGESLDDSDSLNFDKPITNIAKTLASINDIHRGGNSAIILLSDGNSTFGPDYEFETLNNDINIYPIVLGDTTTYEDIRISQVNSNKYAFLKNSYPLEVNIAYSGDRSIETPVRIFVENKEVYRELIKLNANQNNITVNTLLDASSVGIQNIRVQIDSINNEKNLGNNKKTIAIEVIDEKTNITIVSSIKHPDIGMLKKAIESNEQRVVNIIAPNSSKEILEDTDVFILYQPNRSFGETYNFIKNKRASIFTVTGLQTDWNFLNQIQNSFSKEVYNQSEAIVPVKNEAFSLFDISTISFAGYPPLKSNLGEILITKPFETIAYQKIKGVNLNEPLLLIFDDKDVKEATLFGEDIWKWRMQAYREDKGFDYFDNLISKTMLYLSDSNQKSRLELDYETIFNGSADMNLMAAYFDETYTFDSNANLILSLEKSDGVFSGERPMLLKTNSYEADLSGLEAGEYNFIVTVKDENLKKTGRFTVLDFDLESQFSSSNDKKLKRLAEKTGGELYYPSQLNSLIESLTSNLQYTPTQKNTKNVVSLIDFHWLLAIIVLALALEWFIRKYNGLL
ncbi:VWA domain-containing protein [Croceitalea rosinachiae]|uniref:VWA domain-containing protein n=1 Tax=Croceitalea rosinachiae TaxID=3075596 RepID=A0ABU3ABF4_9FLAO|nr:VWA domain-containing protein [Croceitalea sp. F388]MDT0607489.1 VWA domain-containing protein [Croceitalea sp. F388]